MRSTDAPEAPTHLGAHQLPLPPEWLPDEDEPPTRAARGSAPAPITASISTQRVTERSAMRPRDPRDRGIVSGELPRRAAPAPQHGPASRPRQRDAASERPAARAADTREGSAAVQRSAPEPRRERSASAREAARAEESRRERSAAAPRPSSRGSQPALARPDDSAAAPLGPAPDVAIPSAPAAPGGVGAFDPMQIAVPPELGGPIYSWVRRLALQADLLGADRVLRDALLDLTSSLSVAIVYPGDDGLWTLGPDDEIPREAAPIVAVAQARRAVIASHTALVPVVTSSETVAVVLLTRNPRNPAYHPIEQVAMIALAREAAAILHHLAIGHLQRASEIKADQGGLYRGEALEAHRTRGNEGVPVHLSPGWVRRTYPILVVSLVLAAFASIFVTVPTYSSGGAVVVVHGAPITAPAAGTVEQVLVQPGQQVNAGTILVRLHAAEQDAEYTSAKTDADNLTIQYLVDQQDEQVKKSLAAALVRVEREQARVEARVVRAKQAGTVSDIRVQLGQLLQPGDHILQIVEPGTEPEVWAFLPGKDRPRLRAKQTLQVELVGYTKTRELATISHVAPEIIGGNEAAKLLGAQLADSLKLTGGSYVFIKARLPSRKFRTEHRSYHYHHGMPAKTEVKLQQKPFLVTLLPALEKYLPD